MATLQIPTLSDGTAYYSQRVALEGVDYQFAFRWSTREERWYLTIRDTQGTMLVGELKLVTNWSLLLWYHDREGVPPGELVVVCLTNDRTPPGIDELGVGKRCTLCYTESEE